MQARSRWLMFFLAVIALLVVAIWPRSEPTESTPQPDRKCPRPHPKTTAKLSTRASHLRPQQRRFPALRPRRHRP